MKGEALRRPDNDRRDPNDGFLQSQACVPNVHHKNNDIMVLSDTQIDKFESQCEAVRNSNLVMKP